MFNLFTVVHSIMSRTATFHNQSTTVPLSVIEMDTYDRINVTGTVWGIAGQ